MAPSGGQFPRQVLGHARDGIRLLELGDPGRAQDARGGRSAAAAAAADGRDGTPGRETVTIRPRAALDRGIPACWLRRTREDAGDLDRKVVAYVDDPSGEREAFGLVRGLEVVDLCLDFRDAWGQRGGRVGYHVVHCGEWECVWEGMSC